MTTTASDHKATDVATFIREHATAQDLEILKSLGELRRKVVWTAMGSAVRPGVTVEIRNMRPKYLNALVGTVIRIDKNAKGVAFVSLRLEPGSATRLAKSRRGQEGDLLEGIPLTALTPRT